ncbi:Daunorubicin/doxorubicin resistance ATP-binding protein DrrA [compost metagenome]
MKPVIEMEHVDKEYKGKKAVDDLTLCIGEGSLTALLGPNGAGKTTSVSMMLGLQQPSRGSIRVWGGRPGDRAVRERIGAMLQDISVIDRLKVSEVIDLFRRYYSKPLPLQELLRLSGLEPEKHRMASALSGGQKRRLEFALALAGDPSVLFLDEPTVGMDITSRQAFWETIRSLHHEGRTIILTTHYLEEADQLADKIAVINHGRMIASGTTAEIKAAQGSRSISFTAGPGVTEEALSAMPAVLQLERDGDRVKLASRNTDRLIRALVQSGLDIRDIEIRNAGLEEAFRTLIQEDEQ